MTRVAEIPLAGTATVMHRSAVRDWTSERVHGKRDAEQYNDGLTTGLAQIGTTSSALSC